MKVVHTQRLCRLVKDRRWHQPYFLYSYPRGGSTVSGASIRFAEELARCWGGECWTTALRNFVETVESRRCRRMLGIWRRTLSRCRTLLTLTKESGGKMDPKLTSDRDIYEINANMAARRLRARILAVLPNWFVEDCINECKKTLAGKNETPLLTE